MSVRRESLYQEIWAEPMTVVAARYEVSSNFLARICARLRIPRPPRGYWAKQRAGLTPMVPPLPKAPPGVELEWVRGGQGERAPHAPPSPRRKRVPDPAASRPVNPDLHPLLEGIEPHFAAARVSSTGFLRPNKRLMADFFVSKDILPRALDFANRLYRDLEGRGHRVQFAPTDAHFPRPPLNPCPGKTTFPWESWHPSRPTVVMIGTLAIGLTIFEVSEEVEAEYRNGKYVRVSDLPVPKRRTRFEGIPYRYPHEFLTGRLALQAYSPYQKTDWTRVWYEKEPGNLVAEFDEIARVLKRQAAVLAREVKAIREQERIEQELWLAQRREWEIQEAERRVIREREEEERRRAQAIKDSQEELLSLLSRWDQASRIRHFLAELEDTCRKLEGPEKSLLQDRINRAREFLGTTDATTLLRSWRTPEER